VTASGGPTEGWRRLRDHVDRPRGRSADRGDRPCQVPNNRRRARSGVPASKRLRPHRSRCRETDLREATMISIGASAPDQFRIGGSRSTVRLWRHEDHRSRRLGPLPTGTQRCHAAPTPRAQRHFHRHRDSYGPDVSEELIRERCIPIRDAESPPSGPDAFGPGNGPRTGTPRTDCAGEGSLRKLGVEQIDLAASSDRPARAPRRTVRFRRRLLTTALSSCRAERSLVATSKPLAGYSGATVQNPTTLSTAQPRRAGLFAPQHGLHPLFPLAAGRADSTRWSRRSRRGGACCHRRAGCARVACCSTARSSCRSPERSR